ncbi:transcriptional regulator FeaR [Pseudomonas sp. C32]|uniref:transcriptional regulator FeaR n=1 Tax=Pseudomonas sp. C32 TaxID=1529208 RepID=UPI00262FE654|nr:transcriptional regulator FeaR [Pseudomonas sp. C32]MDN4546352.1 transcriptional regulator FeaR [Pseudomonas sp. C32]
MNPGLQVRERLDNWLRSINQVCGTFDAEALSAEFYGNISEFRNGALNLSIVEACQVKLYRSAREVAAGDGGKYFAVFQQEGRAMVAQGENQVVLSSGDITLINADQPCDLTYREYSRQLSLILPQTLVEQGLRFSQVRCGEKISANSPMAVLSHRLIMSVTRQPILSRAESEATMDAIISLLRPAIGRAQEEVSPHERIMRKSLAFIDLHICNEELCPEMLAREMGVSVRGLYRQFAKSGLVVAQYIKNRRLDFCAESLRQGSADITLSSLGYAWGFSDSSHFFFAFKSRFGMAPGEYRKKHA